MSPRRVDDLRIRGCLVACIRPQPGSVGARTYVCFVHVSVGPGYVCARNPTQPGSGGMQKSVVSAGSVSHGAGN
jgi:hypothetical protein